MTAEVNDNQIVGLGLLANSPERLANVVRGRVFVLQKLYVIGPKASFVDEKVLEVGRVFVAGLKNRQACRRVGERSDSDNEPPLLANAAEIRWRVVILDRKRIETAGLQLRVRFAHRVSRICFVAEPFRAQRTLIPAL